MLTYGKLNIKKCVCVYACETSVSFVGVVLSLGLFKLTSKVVGISLFCLLHRYVETRFHSESN